MARSKYLFGFVKLLSRVSDKARSMFYGQVFGIKKMHVGPQPKFLGVQYINLGERFSTGRNVWVEAVTSFNGKKFLPELTVGSDCNLSDFVHIGCINKVSIGSGVLIGSKVLISDHSHGRYHGETQSSAMEIPNQRELYSKGPVIVEDNVFIGDNCCVQAGVTIGRGAIIAANSTVTSDIAADTMVAGSPARPIKKYSASTHSWENAKPGQGNV